MSRLRERPVLWVNVGLAVALVAALVIALVALRSTPQAAAATTRTATVRTGTVTATVMRGGQESVVPVQVGLVGDNGTQILSGLNPGDTVVLPSVSSASTGGGFPVGVGGGLGR